MPAAVTLLCHAATVRRARVFDTLLPRLIRHALRFRAMPLMPRLTAAMLI